MDSKYLVVHGRWPGLTASSSCSSPYRTIPTPIPPPGRQRYSDRSATAFSAATATAGTGAGAGAPAAASWYNTVGAFGFGHDSHTTSRYAMHENAPFHSSLLTSRCETSRGHHHPLWHNHHETTAYTNRDVVDGTGPNAVLQQPERQPYGYNAQLVPSSSSETMLLPMQQHPPVNRHHHDHHDHLFLRDNVATYHAASHATEAIASSKCSRLELRFLLNHATTQQQQQQDDQQEHVGQELAEAEPPTHEELVHREAHFLLDDHERQGQSIHPAPTPPVHVRSRVMTSHHDYSPRELFQASFSQLNAAIVQAEQIPSGHEQQQQTTSDDHACTTSREQQCDDKTKAKRARVCRVEGCDKYVVDRGLCVRHGGGKRCYIEECQCRAQYHGLCWKHGGYKMCTVEGCKKRAKSRGICWSHGGGTRCSREDCDRVAVSRSLCWAHGGGKRCRIDGCQRPASRKQGDLCAMHLEAQYKESLAHAISFWMNHHD